MAITALLIFESKWASQGYMQLTAESRLDRHVAEPGEMATLTVTVANRAKHLTTFVRDIENLPGEADIYDNEDWLNLHRQKLVSSQYINKSYYLTPLSQRTGTVKFSIQKRGSYIIGRRSISAGDLLGLREQEGFADTAEQFVVYPHRSEDIGKLTILGSFLGEISVRRFIMEDPILTVGFNDYTGREPMKSISWKRTAMTGSLQVNNYDHTMDQKVMVIVNTELGDPDELEEVFSTTRVVCEQLEDRRIAYSILTNGRFEGNMGVYSYLPEGIGESHLANILFSLGCADYSCFMQFDRMIERALRLTSGIDETSYIIVSPKLQPAGREALALLKGKADGRVTFLDCGKGGAVNV